MKTTAPGEFEVLPPERQRAGLGKGGAGHEAMSHLIAYLMDNVIKVPGLKKGIGINPFLDLIPVVGDGAATVVQMLTILEGARRGVPKIVLARMGMNILLNGIIGVVPGVGEAFSWWFRPSSRNYQLLLDHAPQTGGSVAAPTRKNTAGEFLFVFGLLAVLLVVMGALIALGWHILNVVWYGGMHLLGA